MKVGLYTFHDKPNVVTVCLVWFHLSHWLTIESLQKMQKSFNEKIEELLEKGRKRDRELEVGLMNES